LDAYLENWQKQRIRSPAVYEAEGRARRWMYTVDLQGRLFLEEMRKKDLTSCLKNDKVSWADECCLRLSPCWLPPPG